MATVPIPSDLGAQENKVYHCFYFFPIYFPWSDGMDDSQAVIKISERNINNLRYADDTTLMAESKEEVRSLLIRVKKESAKAGLKFNIQNTKIVAYSPIISWQIEGEKVKTVTVLFSWAPKSVQMVTAALKLKYTCSLEEKLWQT